MGISRDNLLKGVMRLIKPHYDFANQVELYRVSSWVRDSYTKSTISSKLFKRFTELSSEFLTNWHDIPRCNVR